LKKLLIIFFLLYGQLVAFDKKSTLKIYDKIFTSMFHGDSAIYVYTPNNEYKNLFDNSSYIKPIKDLFKADIAFVTTKDELSNVLKKNPKIAVFTTNRHLLYDYQAVVGAFYWTKGRKQLIFIKDRLDKHHLKLPKEYEKYMVDEL